MSNLREQLLKAGLVDEKQAKKAAKEKQKDALRQQGQGGKKGSDEEARQRAQRAQVEKSERDRLLNQQRQEQAEKKALQAQIRQLVEQHRQPKGEGDTPYNFIDQGKVKRLYVDGKTRQAIAKGQLAIVRLEKDYELVPPDIAEKIRARDPASVALLNEPKPQAQPEQAPADDPYAQYQIPDDLMW